MFIHTHTGKDRNCGAVNHIRHLRAKNIHQNPIRYMPSPMRQPVIQSARERKNMLADVFRHITTYSQLVLVWWVLQALDMLHNYMFAPSSVEHCRNHEPLQKLHHFVCE